MKVIWVVFRKRRKGIILGIMLALILTLSLGWGFSRQDKRILELDLR